MDKNVFFHFLILLIDHILLVLTYQHVHTYEFMMPDFNYRRGETNICASAKIRGDFYLVGFEPAPALNYAHHMMLLGCEVPASRESVWECRKSPCNNGSQVLYVWSKEAPGLHLPKDVGFHVGPNSSIPYLILQVHYRRRSEDEAENSTETSRIGKPRRPRFGLIIISLKRGTIDNSGIILMYTDKYMPHEAGIIVLGSNNGYIPPDSIEHIESACTITQNKVIHPLAYRIHTHSLGTVVSGYVVRQGEVADKWTLLGKRNPRLRQGFFPVADNAPIQYGDILAARCTIKNTQFRRVTIGRTNKHEMCHFYLMYWVQNSTPLKKKFCLSPGPPYYYWSKSAVENFKNIPNKDASRL